MAKSHVPYLGKNGRYRVEIGGRNFWLGKDQQTALKLTSTLDAFWVNEKHQNAQGKKCWSDGNIAAAFNLVGLRPPVMSEPRTRVIVNAVQPTTNNLRQNIPSREVSFHQALDLYSSYRLADKTIGEHTSADSESIVKSLKRNLPDQPLHNIDGAALGSIRDTLLARPPRVTDGKPISVATVKKWFMELGMAFSWFSHPDSRIGWQPPYPQWREKFTLDDRQAANLSDDDEYGAVKPTFTLDQLTILYKVGTPKERFYLLLGVFLGWTAKEIATLKKSQIKDANGEMFIEKKRSKTGVKTTFWVCPELAQILRRAVANTPSNPGDLALLTENRQGEPLPLLHGNTDTVSQTWIRLLHRANKAEQRVPNYPHSRLRKFAGQAVENLSGDHSLAQLLLSHKRADVASTNYIGLGVNVGLGKSPYERLWDVQRLVHKALKPMLDPIKPTPKAIDAVQTAA
jgi:integrase